MPIAHIQFNDQTQHGRILRQGLQLTEQGRAALVNARNVILTMVDGYTPEADPAKLEEAAFSEVTARFGFASNADAKRALDAINLCFAQAAPLIDPLLALFDTFR